MHYVALFNFFRKEEFYMRNILLVISSKVTANDLVAPTACLKAINYGAPFVTSILLLTEATFVQQKLLLSDKSNFVYDKSNFVYDQSTFVYDQSTFVIDKITFV